MIEKDRTVAAVDTEAGHAPGSKGGGGSNKVIAALVIVAFLAFVLVKLVSGGTAPTEAPVQADAGADASATITSVHNDAVADYEAALASGKPVYVLFHSLSCEPCVNISAVVDRVMPEYEGKVVFVNAITGDSSADQLASKFQFQYIPTSFFLKADGTLADAYTGELNETALRDYLDAVVAAE